MIAPAMTSPTAAKNQANVVMAACPRGLIDGEFAHRREVGRRQLDASLAQRSHPVPALADQPRCCGESHLLAEHQHQCIEQQGEAGEFPGPRWLDLPNRAVGQLHPRHPPSRKHSCGKKFRCR